MSNPFEDADGQYLALVNDEGQYSLWPADMDIPEGWTAAAPAAGRAQTLDLINREWTDMRPLSLVRAMDGAADAEQGAAAR
ncbi:MbtH family protein [Streptomyces sp. NPDC002004]